MQYDGYKKTGSEYRQAQSKGYRKTQEELSTSQGEKCLKETSPPCTTLISDF